MVEGVPRFRRDLVETQVEADGVAYVEVRDPATDASFRFYDFEHAIAQQLDGKPLADVASWATETYGFESSAEGIAEFAEQLRTLGFLEDGNGAPRAEAAASPASSFDTAPATGGGDWTESATTADCPRLEPDVASEPRQPASAAAESDEPEISLFADAPTTSDPGLESAENSDGAPPAPASPPELPADALIPMDTSPSASAAPSDPPPPPERTSPPARADMSPEVRRWTNAFDDLAAPGDDSPPARAAAPAPRTPPAGERRQPPQPGDVSMAPFEEALRPADRLAPSAPPARSPRRSSKVGVVIVALLVAIAVAAAVIKLRERRGPAPIPVRVMAATPSSVYSWFTTRGAVRAGGTVALTFASAGKVAEVLPANAPFRAGESLARLEGSKRLQAEVDHLRERLAYYEQMRETVTAAGNQVEARQADFKIAEKKKLIAEAAAALGKLAIVAAEPGQIVESAVTVGQVVASGTTAVKIKGRDTQGVFELPPEEAVEARRLDFCRVELDDGRPIDCKLAGTADTGRQVIVDLPESEAGAAGKPVRLARGRHEAVFPVPLSAVVAAGGTHRIYVATAAGAAEVRAVTVADRTATHALVSQGIDVGDEVIMEVPAGLADRSPIAVSR